MWRSSSRTFLLHQMPTGSCCAEIGVWKGDFAQEILEVVRPRRLYLIDPWEFQPEFPRSVYGGRPGGAASQAEMEEIYHGVVRRFGRRPSVRILRQSSADSARSFADESLDWVYVDGCHAYEYVKQDLELFAPKVKPGGFLTGDDYAEPPATSWFGVKRAVDEFVAARADEFEPVSFERRQYILRRKRGGLG